MSEAMKNSIDVLNRLSEIADGLSAEVSAIQSLADRAKAALSGAQQGEAEPVAWAVFADNGNIRIWGREKPAGFPDAVPMYLSPTVKDLLTVQIDPIGYADPDTLSDYRAGDRLHIPVYRPDASAEWQAGIPVYLHAAPQPAQVPEGWRLVPVEPTTEMLGEGAIALFAQSREPLSSAYRNMLAAAPRCPMLTAAPSGDAKPAPVDDGALVSRIGDLGSQLHNLSCEHQNNEPLADRLAELAHTAWMIQRSAINEAKRSGDAEREAEAVLQAFKQLAAEYRPHGLNCTYTAFDVANHIEAQGHYYAARLRGNGDDSEGVE